MGIRFACHACDKKLHIKSDFAGRRGVCPQCGVRFRIPNGETPYSTPIEENGAAIVRIQPSEPVLPNGLAAIATATAPRKRIADSSMRSLLDDPIAVWYVRPPSGGQYGPATGDVLRGWITEARITPTSLIWRDGWPQWRTAGEVLSEFGAADAQPITQVHREPAAVAIPTSPTLAGDARIGTRKKNVTQRRFILVGTLAAASMTLIGILIFLLQR